MSQKNTQKNINDIEKEFDEMGYDMFWCKNCEKDVDIHKSELKAIKSFYREQLKELLEGLKEDITKLIAEEILIAIEDQQRTSRLTSLGIKIDKLLNE